MLKFGPGSSGEFFSGAVPCTKSPARWGQWQSSNLTDMNGPGLINVAKTCENLVKTPSLMRKNIIFPTRIAYCCQVVTQFGFDITIISLQICSAP